MSQPFGTLEVKEFGKHGLTFKRGNGSVLATLHGHDSTDHGCTCSIKAGVVRRDNGRSNGGRKGSCLRGRDGCACPGPCAPLHMVRFVPHGRDNGALTVLTAHGDGSIYFTDFTQCSTVRGPHNLMTFAINVNKGASIDPRRSTGQVVEMGRFKDAMSYIFAIFSDGYFCIWSPSGKPISIAPANFQCIGNVHAASVRDDGLLEVDAVIDGVRSGGLLRVEKARACMANGMVKRYIWFEAGHGP